MVQPKWTPKSSQGDRKKHSFSNHLFANFVLRNPLSGRSRYALHFENNKKGIGCINIVDVLTGAMVDLPKEHPKSKTSTMLHGNAPAQNGTSATLHGNAFRVFMVRLDASKKVPPKCPRQLFLKVFSMFFDPTHAEVAPRRHRAI